KLRGAPHHVHITRKSGLSVLLKTSKINAGFSLGGAFLAQSAFSCPLIEASINLSVRALPAVPPTNQQRFFSSLRSSDLSPDSERAQMAGAGSVRLPDNRVCGGC